ncbi:helix-turn-helix transcriptional regulator [Chloroflexota bacterium]
MEHLSKNVKELRVRNGWAQEDLAREIGVSLSTVQRWERLGAKPNRMARRELARLFNEAGIIGERDTGSMKFPPIRQI